MNEELSRHLLIFQQAGLTNLEVDFDKWEWQEFLEVLRLEHFALGRKSFDFLYLLRIIFNYQVKFSIEIKFSNISFCYSWVWFSFVSDTFLHGVLLQET